MRRRPRPQLPREFMCRGIALQLGVPRLETFHGQIRHSSHPPSSHHLHPIHIIRTQTHLTISKVPITSTTFTITPDQSPLAHQHARLWKRHLLVQQLHLCTWIMHLRIICEFYTRNSWIRLVAECNLVEVVDFFHGKTTWRKADQTDS